MKYLPLIWAALLRRKTRTIVTLLSIMAAFLLFGLLDSVRNAFEKTGQNAPGATRLVIISKINPFLTPLPLSLQAGIQAVPGVTGVTYGSAFGGYYQDPKNRVPIEAHADNFIDLYPEWELSPAEREAYRNTRTGAVAEESLAKKYHWKIGDRIPLHTELEQKNGSKIWTFDLVGIFHFTDPNRPDDERQLFFHWEYFEQARRSDNGTAMWYIANVAKAGQADSASQAIDAMAANSGHETQTQTENAFYAALMRQLGDIGLITGSIMGAVFFTLVLLTGNTMAQAVRERIPEMATLKTIGFTSRSIMGLVLSESVLLLVLGSALGLAVSTIVIGGWQSTLGRTLPISPVAGDIWFRGLALALIVGLVVGIPPAMRGMRLRIVEALSGR